MTTGDRLRNLEAAEQSLVGDGDPNGVTSAAEGTRYWDYTNDTLYANTDGATAWQIIGGGGGVPVNGQFLVLAFSGALTSERRFVDGDGLQATDGGPNANYILSADVSDFAGTGLEDDGAENLRIAASAADDGLTGGGGVPLAVDLHADLAANLLGFTGGELDLDSQAANLALLSPDGGVGKPGFRPLVAADIPAEYVRLDGTLPLTAPWDAGAHKITALQLESDIAIGTAPLVVASTTVVTNLNADLLDGQHGAYYAPTTAIAGTAGRVAQFAAGGAAVEDANLVAPASLLTLVAAAPYTLTVPATGTVGLLGTAQTWTAVNTFDENILQADAKRIVTDEVRARDTDGLKLYNADGKGLRVGVGGHAAMGSGATSTAKILYLLEHFAGATSYGLDVEAQQHDDYTLYGGRFQATYTAAATGDKATGLHGLEVVAYNKSTHTVNVARGVHSYIRQNTTGTISQARGFVSRVDNPLGAIIYRYGFLCYDSPNTVNNRGLYVANLTGSGSVFAIYTNTGPVRFGDKVMFTQTDGNEAIDSLNDGYMDYLATTLHRFDNPLTIASLKSGATQAAAGAAATELWKTSSHATLPDNVAMIGV